MSNMKTVIYHRKMGEFMKCPMCQSNNVEEEVDLNANPISWICHNCNFFFDKNTLRYLQEMEEEC